ncbi:MAG: polysaccharide pyruvyl transferase family protein [Fibrobacter sp.]|jgi:hypothetical protein|nr:polysaccharide pyruvyl transferase family protein [Fibrobacter sp.]
MKIGILTFYKVLNYGAVLQAYALQKTLQKMGHDVFLINYQPKELIKPYKTIKIKYLRKIDYLLKWYRRFFLFRPFKCFIGNYLNEGIVYTSLQQLIDNPPAADAYVVGSDQVWNLRLSGNSDTFFLSFGGGRIMKIAYAASCGGNYSFLNDENKLRLLRDFNSVSVREKSLRDELSKKDFNSEVVLDPTFLWSNYSEFIRENNNGNYILVYYVVNNSNFRNKLKYLKKILKLSVINIGPDYIGDADKNLRGVSPSEWVNLLHHAECVYTNSFHGVAFSINLGKKFLYIPNGKAGDSRVLDLLFEIGLQSRVINEYHDIDKCINAKEFPIANDVLTQMREHSLQFLSQINQRFEK